MSRPLSSAAKFALHAARSGWISRLDKGWQISDATMRGLALRGLVTIDLSSYGRWSIAKLTDAGRKACADMECPACKGISYVASPDDDGTGITCSACLGLGYKS